MNRCVVPALVAIAWSLLAVHPASAQGLGEGLDTERFKPALDSQGVILTEGGEGERAGDLNLGFYLVYSRRPLVLNDADGNLLQALVSDRLAANFFLSMGMTDWLTVGVDVPAVFYQAGDEIPGDTGPALATACLGDIRVAPKFTLLRQESFGISLAVDIPVSLPSGDEAAFLGSDSVTVMPTIALSRSFFDKRLLVAVNTGAWIREQTEVLDLEAGHELFYKAGARFRFVEDWAVSGELAGGARIESMGENKPKETPLEWLVAVHYFGPWDLQITLGGAVGTLPGWGTPNFRGFLGLLWAPRVHDRDEDGIEDEQDRCPDESGPAENGGCPWRDTDGDGLTDDRDRCPEQAGPRENAGCPWGDADDDGVTDNIDKCPQEKGPAENKGCPWGDADEDGVTDNIDKCPQEKGAADNAGCPWGDSDEDGLLDNVDKCPQDAEDKDGFEDDDGCPDPDNDKDGIPDKDDKCPLEAEVINGFRDDDGCPDKGRVVVIVRKEKIEILQKIYFATGKAVIRSRSFSLLNQVALTMKAHMEIKKIRIEGHTDSQGSDKYNLNLSQKRAEAVRKYLVDKGVAAERLDAVGYGESRPIAPNRTARGREKNRRVEFVIVEQ